MVMEINKDRGESWQREKADRRGGEAPPIPCWEEMGPSVLRC